MACTGAHMRVTHTSAAPPETAHAAFRALAASTCRKVTSAAFRPLCVLLQARAFCQGPNPPPIKAAGPFKVEGELQLTQSLEGPLITAGRETLFSYVDMLQVHGCSSGCGGCTVLLLWLDCHHQL